MEKPEIGLGGIWGKRPKGGTLDNHKRFERNKADLGNRKVKPSKQLSEHLKNREKIFIQKINPAVTTGKVFSFSKKPHKCKNLTMCQKRLQRLPRRTTPLVQKQGVN